MELLHSILRRVRQRAFVVLDPHEIARVVLYEQLYRAHTIRRGEKYHRGS